LEEGDEKRAGMEMSDGQWGCQVVEKGLYKGRGKGEGAERKGIRSGSLGKEKVGLRYGTGDTPLKRNEGRRLKGGSKKCSATV